MANVTFDIQWREAMTDLLEELEAECPEDPSLTPKSLVEFSCMYIKYLQIYKKLEESYDQIVHPQKRMDLRKALEATIGRLLEIKYWLVKLNNNVNDVSLDDILVDLKLNPEVLTVPPPRFLRDDRVAELESRDKFLLALMDKYEQRVPAQQPQPPDLPPPLSEQEAIAVIQSSERGRQARVRAQTLRVLKQQQEEELQRQRMGNEVLSHDVAAVRIQAAARGFISRRRTKRMADEELMFIGMKPMLRDPETDPVLKENRNQERRKVVQAANKDEYEESVVAIKAKVRELEGQDMREMIQDKVNKWFLENRNPATGDYPDFPGEEIGGSKYILNPPPKTEEADEEVEDSGGKKGGDKKGGDKKGGDKKGGDKKGGDKKGGDKKGAKEDEVEEPKEEQPPKFFSNHVKDAVSSYCATWQDKDETANLQQKHDPDLIKASLRPVVFEEVRAEVDKEMEVLLQNLKDMVAAERAAKSGKGKKGKKDKKGGGKKKKKKDGEGKGKEKGQGKGKKGKKGKKDPTADRSIESLYAELVSNGIVKPCPAVELSDYVGAYNFLGTTLEKAGIRPDPSMAQTLAQVTETCVLPFASQFVHQNAPLVKSVLLFGNKGCGKTLLAHAAARAAGANLFDLTPSNTDGKYPAKQAAMMLHIVFKVAKVMAPTVIYISNVEQVFMTDKKRAREYGGTELPSRIKKDLLKELKALEAGERVIAIGCTSRPQDLGAADSKALIGAFTQHLMVPVPDYGSLRLLWPTLVERDGGGKLPYEFDLSTLCQISQGYTQEAIDRTLKNILTRRRVMRLPKKPLNVDEIIRHLYKQGAVDKETDQAIREWSKKLPCNRPKTPPETEASATDNKKGKDGKGKDDAKKKKK